MSVQNLATVFGPNILRPKVEDPVTIMEGLSFHPITHTAESLVFCVWEIICVRHVCRHGTGPAANGGFDRTV